MTDIDMELTTPRPHWLLNSSDISSYFCNSILRQVLISVTNFMPTKIGTRSLGHLPMSHVHWGPGFPVGSQASYELLHSIGMNPEPSMVAIPEKTRLQYKSEWQFNSQPNIFEV